MRELSKEEVETVSGGFFEEYGYAMDSGGGDYYGSFEAAPRTDGWGKPLPPPNTSTTITLGTRG
jgi:hypothetical protein